LKRGETQLQQLDIPQLIRDALAITHSDLVVRRVDVTCRIAEGLPRVQGDRVQIQQVLLNLLLNAAEAMNENEPHDRHIDLVASPADGAVMISVLDRGAGIARDQLDRVFEAFYTTKKNGLGLGLAICRSIVVAHGGRLWATSDGSRGSAFHFTLPTAGGNVPEPNDRGP
jgi:two-component system sensor kinase FixL